MIPIAEPFLKGNEKKYLDDCVDSGWISSAGAYVKRFEKEFSKYIGSEYGVSCMNGTVALHLALEALEVKQRDEIIVPSFTYIATANAVSYTGAKPIFVDSDIETWNIDSKKIEDKLTKKTKAIIPVHLYGHPCDMDIIKRIANKNNLYIIEDAAEAHGAEYQNKKVGSFGDISCFSFFGNKIITTGEGGMCLTDNALLAEKMESLRNHSMSKSRQYWHDSVGFNYRMTNMQAAVGCAQVENIEEIVKIKRDNAEFYNFLLKDTKGITLPPEKEWAKNVYWMYSILIKEDFGIDRDELMNKLKQEEIETRPFFYPVPEMPPYKNDEEYPVSQKLSRQGINLPSSANLTKEQIKRVVDMIKESSL